MKLKSAKLTILLLVAAVFILAFLFYADVGSAQAQEEACKTGLQSLNLTTWAVACGAAVDAVNPCEFAILILLMASMLIEEENRKKALFTGLSFIGAVFVAYFLMGIGLLETIRATTLALSSYFYKIVGILAVIFGLLNIKDYFWYGGGGFLMEVPPRWRPKMKEFIRKATTPWGGFAIGLLISLFLLPCTSGPYVVILSMLAAKTTFFKAFVYLIFYNLIFITPMAAIVLAMYFGLPPEKAENWRKNKIRLLHLVAGVILLALGAVILFGLI